MARISMEFKFICARCKKYVRTGEPEGRSAIYGSSHDLCEPCFFAEDAEIEERGTNNLPETLAKYGTPNTDGW